MKSGPAGKQQGTRALNELRDAVEKAVELLGAGFLRYSGNQELRRKLRAGELLPEEYKNQLLRWLPDHISLCGRRQRPASS